ncbi:MAG: ferrous iron transport protein B [Clostridia bacterium]|nr:ferrous iron transport protein B [Clostridia bacterium]
MQTLCIVGNANSGKTTLFNKLTESFEHTGNFSGVTVDVMEKIVNFKNDNYKIVDLPGIYSLSPFTIEEKVATNYLLKGNHKIINLCEPKSLKRSLNLTLQLIEAGFEVVLLINRVDKHCVSQKIINKIKEELKIEVFELNIRKEKDLSFLFNLQNYKLNGEVDYINKYKKCSNFQNAIVPIKICEEDDEIIKTFNLSNKQLEEIKTQLNKNNLNFETICLDRQILIDKICTTQSVSTTSNKLDKILLNKYLAIPIFLCVMLGIFYITFSSLGSFLSSVLDKLICQDLYVILDNALQSINTNAIFNDYLLTAVIEGVGSLICFLPQIVLLFIFIAILEDSGYLPRLAFLLDDIFKKFGLSGKSLFTFVMSFGCSTSAMLTAKNQDNEKSKIKTMMLAQYMSCSAKLPIFTVLCSAFFTNNALLIFCFYIIGILVSLLVALILQSGKLKTTNDAFVLEIPFYSFPSFDKIIKVALKNGKEFLVRVGGIVLIFMSVVWLLENFNYKLQFVSDSSESLLYSIGSIIAPIFTPLGFGNYGVASALIAGLVAKEIVISTISMLNHTMDNQAGLITSLTASSSLVCFDTASALSFMTFVLLYAPCISSMSLMKKEIGTRYLLLAIALQFAFAYLISFFVYTFALLLSNALIVIILTILVLTTFVIICLSKGKSTCKSCNFSACTSCNKCKSK